MASDTDTSFDIYVADVAGYPRPTGAAPMRLSLVPAYSQCTAPNRMHGPPLALRVVQPAGGRRRARRRWAAPMRLAGGQLRGLRPLRGGRRSPGLPEDSDVSYHVLDVRRALQAGGRELR